MPSKTINVLIADDHELIRSGIKYIIAEAADSRVVGEAADGLEATKVAEKVQWDVAILDVNMPRRNGIDVLKFMHATWPKRGILILSIYPEAQYAVRAIESGASGYLSKQSVSAELVKAIRHVSRGGKFITPGIAELLACALGSRQRESGDTLSNRELQVLMLIASGKPLVQVADLLNLDVSTVSVYRRRVLNKLGLDSTSELIRYGIENGLVE